MQQTAVRRDGIAEDGVVDGVGDGELGAGIAEGPLRVVAFCIAEGDALCSREQGRPVEPAGDAVDLAELMLDDGVGLRVEVELVDGVSRPSDTYQTPPTRKHEGFGVRATLSVRHSGRGGGAEMATVAAAVRVQRAPAPSEPTTGAVHISLLSLLM